MKFDINNIVNEKNVKEAIKYLFNTDNYSHQAIILFQLNSFLNNTKVLITLRDYIYKNSNKIKNYPYSLDTCGTGGDGLKTLNISTSVALLLSSMNIPIAKHGNRAASSNSGSTDIINELNIKSESNVNKLHKNIKKNKFAYLNAPLFYPQLGKVAQIRRMLSFKTIFNYMGPTLNPLRAKYQILGTTNKESAEIMVKILSNISLKNFTVFYSEDGMDEISLFSPTYFYFKQGTKISRKRVSNNYYKKYLVKKPNFNDIKGKDPKYNANRLIQLFQGKKDSYRDMVIINSIYGMQTIKPNLNFDNCYDLLNSTIDNGIALSHLEKLQNK